MPRHFKEKSENMIVRTSCFLLFCCVGLVFASQSSERDSQSVEVTFYQLSKSEWSSAESSFKTLVANEASSYCASNSDCGLSAGFSFTSSEVGISSGPNEESKSLKIKFYIDFPSVHILSSSSSTTYVVNSATAEKIIANVRSAAESAVGHDITYIGDEFYSIDPDAFLNQIIIPVAFVVLILIIILAIILHVWSKRKAKEEEKRVKAADRDKRRRSARVTPVHTVAREGKQIDKFWPRRKKTEGKERVGRKHGGGGGSGGRSGATFGHVPTMSMRTGAITCDSDPMCNDHSSEQTTPVNNNHHTPVRHNALPPLVSTPTIKDDAAAAKEEKEKEKKRKKREKRQQQQQEKEAKEEERRKASNEGRPSSKSPEKKVVLVQEVTSPKLVL